MGRSSWFLAFACAAVTLSTAPAAFTQDATQPAEQTAEVGEPIPADIQQAIADLGSEDYTVRHKATEFLWAAGTKAIPALRQASQSDDVEISTRARNVLSKFKFGILDNTPAEVVQKIERYRYGDNNQKLAVIRELATAGQIKAVQTLAEAETDENLKTQIVQIIIDQAGATVPAMLARGDFAKAEEVLSIASTSNDNHMRNYAAYLMLRGGLSEFIAEKSKSGLLNEADYALLSQMHRAAGNLPEARAAAEKAGDAARYLLPILFEQGDWKELAARHDDQGREGIEHLGFSAAYHRLAGDNERFEARINEISKFLADTKNIENQPTLIWYATEALLINDRPAAALELLKQHRRLEALELLALRLDVRGALTFYGLTDFDAADGWYDGFKPPADPNGNEDGRFKIGLEVARALHRVNKVESARKLLARLVEQNTNDAKKLLDIARAEHQLGLADEALAHAAKAIAAGADAEQTAAQLFSAPIAALWWRVAQKDGAGEDAAASLRRVRESLAAQAKGDAAALGKLSELVADAENIAAPNADEKKAKQVALFTAVAEALRVAGERAKARELFEKSLAAIGEEDPAKSADLLLAIADLWREEENWAKAAESYHAVFEKANARHIALYMEGHCKSKAGDEAEGRRLMELAALLPLADADQRYQFGAGMRQRGLLDEAAAQWEIALRTGRHDAQGSGNSAQQLGNFLSGKDNTRAAELWQRQLLDCLRTNTQFLEHRAYCTLPHLIHKTRARGLIAQGKLDEAAREVELSEAALPGDIRLAIDLVPEFEKAGRQDAADKLFTANYEANLAVLKDFPDSPHFLNQAAWLAANCDRKLDEALQQAEQAVKLEPDNAAYIDTLAEVHFRRGDKAKAVELARRALELAPDNPEFRERLKRFEGA